MACHLKGTVWSGNKMHAMSHAVTCCPPHVKSACGWKAQAIYGGGKSSSWSKWPWPGTATLGRLPDQPVFSNRALGYQILWTCSQIALWPLFCHAMMMQSLSYRYPYLYFPHANKETQRGKWQAWGEFSLGRGGSSAAQISTSSSCFKCSPKQTKLLKMKKKKKEKQRIPS